MSTTKLIARHHPLKNAQKFPVVFALRCLPFSTTVTVPLNPASPSSSTSFREHMSVEMADYLASSSGFSAKEAKDVCARLGSRPSVEKAEKSIGFFREVGFSDTQIRETISAVPQFLVSKVEKTLRPKLRSFLDWGLSPLDVADMFARNPFLLKHSLERYIAPVAGIIKSFITDDRRATKSIKAFFVHPFFVKSSLVKDRMEANLSSLRSHGIPYRPLVRLMVTHPKTLCLNPSTLEKKVAMVKELGFQCDSTNFSEALMVACSLKKSTWDAKIHILKEFGWTEEQAMAAVHKFPTFMTMSQTTLRKKMEFFVGKLGYDPWKLAANPTLLSYHIENRVIPRVAVIKELDSKKLLKSKRGLYGILQIKEESFYTDYVLKNKDECPEMFQAYKNSTKRSVARQ